jgi:hypothetical protein
VNVDELADTTLGLQLYAVSFTIELETIGDTLPADFATIAAKDEGARSTIEQKVFNGVSAFAPYAIALQLASSLPLFSPKQVTDGKAGFSRYADSPYKASIERCEREYQRFKAYLQTQYGSYKSSGTVVDVRSPLTISSPTSDPVTGT